MSMKINTLLHTPYVNVYDLEFAPGKHYYDATRRSQEEIFATKSEEEMKQSLPDAISCVLVLEAQGQEPRLCLMKEYRYPIGRYVLSVPSGLIDPRDMDQENPIFHATIREVQEETGVHFDLTKDTLQLINPLLYCSPGFTDECSALVKMHVHCDTLPELHSRGSEEGELFDGYLLLTKEEAKEILRNGVDHDQMYYPFVTWTVLMSFVSDLFSDIE